MPVFIGRNSSGVPTFALGTNDSKLHDYPPDSSLVFRSDLPYILVDEYTVSAYSDIASETGNVRYFSLPEAVVAARNALNVILLYWVNGTTIVPCTPQFFIGSWYGSTNGSENLTLQQFNKKLYYNNPSYVCKTGTNAKSSSSSSGLSVSNPVLFNSLDDRVGFPLFGSRSFTPTQLRCLVLTNLQYTSSSNPLLVHTKTVPSTSLGVKISKTQFLINNIDFRTKKLLVYSGSASKPTNSVGVTDVSSNLVNKYPGISTYTSNKLFSVALSETRPDTSKTFNLIPSQYSILSGIRDAGTTIYGQTGYNTYRSSTIPDVTDFNSPVFGVMVPSSASASIEIDSRTSTIKLAGAEFLSPNIKPLYNISAGKQFTFAGSSYTKNTTSDSDLQTEVLLGTMGSVFRSSTSKGCGILTVGSTTQLDLSHNTYALNKAGRGFFGITTGNLVGASMTTVDTQCMHSALVQLSEGEKITLFTSAMNTSEYVPYVGGASGGLSINVFVKRVGADLYVYARFDDGGLQFSYGTTQGSAFYYSVKLTVPAFSFAFTELH